MEGRFPLPEEDARTAKKASDVASQVFGLGYRRSMKKLLRDSVLEGQERAGKFGAAPSRRIIDRVWKRNVRYVERIHGDLANAVDSGQLRSVGDLEAWLRSNEYREVLMGRHLAKQGLWGGFARAIIEDRPDAAWLWVLGRNDNHCDTCIERGGSVYTYDELMSIGLPGSDSLDCGGNCWCGLEETQQGRVRTLNDMFPGPIPLPQSREPEVMPESRVVATEEENSRLPKGPTGETTGRGVVSEPDPVATLVREVLATGPVEKTWTLDHVHSYDGLTADVAAATIDGERVFVKRGRDVPGEAAARLVNAMLDDLVLMPEMVVREDDDVPSMFAVFESGRLGKSFADYQTWQVEDIALFDAVIANPNRHPWNMVDDNGRVTVIDHGLAFNEGEMYNHAAVSLMGGSIDANFQHGAHPELGLEDHHRRALTNLIDRLGIDRYRKALESVIGREQTERLLKRAEWMLENGRIMVVSPGSLDGLPRPAVA
jgi:hypothetical protein